MASEVMVFFDSDTEDAEMEAVMKKIKKKLKAIKTEKSSLTLAEKATNTNTEKAKSIVKMKKIKEKKKLNSRLKRLLSVTGKLDDEGCVDSGVDDMSSSANDSIDSWQEAGHACADNTMLDSMSSKQNSPLNSVTKSNKRKRKTDNSDEASPCQKVRLNDNESTSDKLLAQKATSSESYYERKLPDDSRCSRTKPNPPQQTGIDKSRLVALDCEFVGVGKRKLSALGRCSIVNYQGHVICDIYARPNDVITDYRTRWSGIRRKDMRSAIPFENAQNHIRRILQDKIVVGHALHNDFQVMRIRHPAHMIRDTAKYKPLREMIDHPEHQTVSLKNLSVKLLGRQIQKREHCSVEDSLAAMDLYKLVEHSWEEDIKLNQNKNTKTCHAKTQVSTANTNGQSAQSTFSTYKDSQKEPSFFDDDYWPDDLNWGQIWF